MGVLIKVLTDPKVITAIATIVAAVVDVKKKGK